MDKDMFWAAKLLQRAYKIVYQANVAVYDSHNYSLAKQFKMYFDVGVFFNRNRWVKNLTRPEKEGIKYLRKELLFLSNNGQKSWILYALVNTTTRFLGYRIGLVEKRLLLHFKKRVTRNKGFWKGQTSQSS